MSFMLDIMARFRDVQITNTATPQFQNTIEDKLILFHMKKDFDYNIKLSKIFRYVSSLTCCGNLSAELFLLSKMCARDAKARNNIPPPSCLRCIVLHSIICVN